MKSRKFIKPMLLVLMAVLLAAYTAACGSGKTQPAAGDQQKTEGSQQEQAAGDQKEEPMSIVVGTDAAYAPFELVDSGGKIVGFDIDLMNAIAEAANLQVTFENTAWEGIFLTLQNGERDALISAISITDERKATMDFSDPYFEAVQLIAIPEGSKITKFTDLKDGYKIGVQSGTTGDIAVSELLGQTSSNIYRYESTPLALKEMENKGVDAVVADNVVILEYIKNHPESKFTSLKDDQFPKEYYGMVVNKGNTELLDRLNKGLKTIKDNGTYDKIMAQYFGN